MRVPEKIIKKDEVAEEQTLEIPLLEQLLEEVDNHNQAIQTTLETNIQDNSNFDLHSMPDDELKSILEFKTTDSNNFHDNDVSTSNHIVQDDYAFAKRLTLITNSLKEQLPRIHSATLKDCLPLIIQESLQTRIPSASEQFSKTQTQLNKKVVKQMNIQFNISHVAQSNKFVTLQKELSKVIKSEVAKKVQVVGLEGLQDVKDLLESAVIIDETVEGEKK
nr:hypothetical protein [Tanacetum cinerariifolium]